MPQIKVNRQNYNLAFIFIYIIWQPLQTYYLHIDGQGLTVLFLALVAAAVNFGKRLYGNSPLSTYPMLCWTLLMAYTFVNSIIKGYHGDTALIPFLRTNFIEPVVFLIVVMIELMRDKKKCLNVILVALLLFMFMGFLHLGYSENEIGRIKAEGIGNRLPLRAMMAVFVAAVQLYDHKLKGGRWAFFLISFFAFYLIIVTSTRKAFVGTVIILLGLAFSRIRKFDLKAVATILVVAIGIVVGGSYIMNQTYLGQRFDEGDEIYEFYDIQLSSNPVINNFLIEFFGDRAIQYEFAISAHKLNPITGIGLCNFKSVTGYTFRLHTEYMVHYCENGLIGLTLFLLFYYLLFSGMRRKKKEGHNMRIYLFGLLSVLFINFTTWTYNNTGVLVVYALIMTQIYSKDIVIHNENSRPS